MVAMEELFSPEALKVIRDEIERVGGNEVFFVGTTNEDRMVDAVEVVARGNEHAVPAIASAASQGDTIIHNHPSGDLRPSDEDVALSSRFGNDGVGSYIVDNSVERVYVVVEPFLRKRSVFVPPERMGELMEPSGPIAAAHGGYEFRPQQIEMARGVTEAFNDGRVFIVEAGTGTGKTLAYLIPAVLWTVESGERVLISTNTINLQEQLMGKDIPLVRRALGIEFKAVLVKGRGNYVCLRKVEDLRENLHLVAEPRELPVLGAIMEWAWISEDGSLSDLNFVPDPDVWEKVAAESDNCARTRCRFYNRCHYFRARREASGAKILVVNHHLLFADLALRDRLGTASDLAILPTYKRVILDEAHHMEDVATSYFGSMATRHAIHRLLERLHRVREGERGFLPLVKARVSKALPAEEEPLISNILSVVDRDIVPLKGETLKLVHETFDALFEMVERSSNEEGEEKKLRLTEELLSTPDWGGMVGQVLMLGRELRNLRSRLLMLGNELKRADRIVEDEFTSLLTELEALAARLDEQTASMERAFSAEPADEVRWIEARPGRGFSVVRLKSAPLEVARKLQEGLYDLFPTVILTSATLTTEGNFGYMRRRIGLDLLDAGRMRGLILSSPFNYREQVMFGIPTDLPDPDEARFTAGIFDPALNILNITGGRAFILFTSFRMLQQAHEMMEGPLHALGITSLKQGTEGRDRLLQRFREDKTSVLFGTDSFWEGVDVVGDALECVIIVKLPFRVPTDPVLQARAEFIQQRGGNPFLEFIVPQAALRFKQGFGRLIRSKTDRGVLIVFDKRIATRSYGKVFLRSLPSCRMITGRSDDILEGLRSFFSRV